MAPGEGDFTENSHPGRSAGLTSVEIHIVTLRQKMCDGARNYCGLLWQVAQAVTGKSNMNTKGRAMGGVFGR